MPIMIFNPVANFGDHPLILSMNLEKPQEETQPIVNWPQKDAKLLIWFQNDINDAEISTIYNTAEKSY